MAPLNILHVLRTPVGGLFRHVLDLTRGQIARGHKVGLVMDADTGGPRADAALAELAPSLALGLSRHAMRRTPGAADIAALTHVMRRIGATRADVVHGHGAKGGAYARLARNAAQPIRVYTPHGGSLHFERGTLAGRLYLGIERLLMSRSDLIVFESAYSAEVFHRKVGAPLGLARVVHNGVTAGEFEPVAVAAEAADLLFIGELRHLKGVDVLIEAIARLHGRGRRGPLFFAGGRRTAAPARQPPFARAPARCQQPGESDSRRDQHRPEKDSRIGRLRHKRRDPFDRPPDRAQQVGDPVPESAQPIGRLRLRRDRREIELHRTVIAQGAVGLVQPGIACEMATDQRR